MLGRVDHEDVVAVCCIGFHRLERHRHNFLANAEEAVYADDRKLDLSVLVENEIVDFPE